MSFVAGVGLTAFGRHEGSSTLDLMSKAAELALADAGLMRGEVDGLLRSYTTTMPHIMLATVFAEHFGIRPAYAHAIQVGGATGMAMAMLAHHAVETGLARQVLVVGGETLVSRTATPEAREHVPYKIVLVDTAEGLRTMAHGYNDLDIGDEVTARAIGGFAGRLVAYFERKTS